MSQTSRWAPFFYVPSLGLAVVAAYHAQQSSPGRFDDVLAGIRFPRMVMFPFGIILGFSTGSSLLWAALGAKHYDRVRAAFRFSRLDSGDRRRDHGGVTRGDFRRAHYRDKFGKALRRCWRSGELCIRLQCLQGSAHPRLGGSGKHAVRRTGRRQGGAPAVHRPSGQLFYYHCYI